MAAYTYGTTAWNIIQAIPLMASPTIILTILSPEVREATVLETYFSRSLGFTLLALGILNLVLTGSIPLSSRLQIGNGVTTDPSDPKAPFAIPTLSITLVYHAVAGFYTYAMWTEEGSFAFGLSTGVSTILAAVGLWCLLFASSDGRISRKTGADKRTSGFPFKNTEAAKKNIGKKR
ncbi:hypothetical protein EJ05DRAFT_472528 [Pseudovirgaria hyperparasitica]|uniref:Uncharacterized protein n=1 Tax=Pseudovirgaria hyperparasitica TaxID=470096 RepID=A0A6A6WHI0_9PEZI|nr:uncharacterized protein EJ05DRAFT_472528 [Pseudovirgaria hyperparasitica]KAF2761545.1 hypothetical protein EJ05DRAFT_472528 [Pseudovirgaria hyperparasitica]